MPPRRNAAATQRATGSPAPVSASSTATASSSSTSTTPQQHAQLVASQGKERAQETAKGVVGAVETLWDNYLEQTPSRLKLIDSFMVFLMLTGIAQFVYCFGVTNYPFNAFIGGFAATVGQFVLCGALRIQSNPDNKPTFPILSPERAFGDFVFGSVLLHFFVWCYLG
ncbi:putative Dolichyl-diphosphooligosaccharide--protein glycotransferase [Rhodotorula taiwanensis]|uniref:Dolichyl-diphosphooligosaccharide--protein glycosyltransferase subunit OST2 n=1 Tax=Rhodotorula taiwanensis TaxID=741276 RepID=A0A2S5B0Y3_9BASI|nr:putative Dolichyl-diphosphooligosaccharide--protein glycotransferase [Rhodotorula taiwanensis]